MDVVKNVVAAVLIHNDKILIAQRSEKDHLAGLWEFPGGKVEPGETHENSLRREILEEFDIEIEVGEFLANSLYSYTNGSINLMAYKCRWIGGEIISSVHQNYAWTTIAELGRYDFAPADVPLVEILRRSEDEF